MEVIPFTSSRHTPERRKLSAAIAISIVAAVSLGASVYRFPAVRAGLTELQVFVRTDRENYTVGQGVNITVLVYNPGRDSVTLHFGSSCQAWFAVEDLSGKTVYNMTHHFGCLTFLTDATVPAGGGWEQFFLWKQINDTGKTIAAPGAYIVFGWIPSGEPLPHGNTRIILTESTLPVDTLVLPHVSIAGVVASLIFALRIRQLKRPLNAQDEL